MTGKNFDEFLVSRLFVEVCHILNFVMYLSGFYHTQIVYELKVGTTVALLRIY